MESLHHQLSDFRRSRIYSLREVPSPQADQMRTWIKAHNNLASELRLVASPELYPLQEKQKKSLRTVEEVQRKLSSLGEPLLKISIPISAWFEESGRDFAGIHVISRTKETWEKIETWERHVAHALLQWDHLGKPLSEDYEIFGEQRVHDLTYRL